MTARVCELCNGEAAIYCASDSAFLCRNCDTRVHQANFLVACHVRRLLCSKCKGLSENRFSGKEMRFLQRTCRSCSPEEHSDEINSFSSYSTSSDCVSSAESSSTAPKKIRFNKRRKTEETSCSSSVTGITVTKESKIPARFSGQATSAGKKKKDEQTVRRRAPNPTGVNRNAEGVFVNWCRKLGLNNNSIVSIATDAFAFCMRRSPVLPSRVTFAAALWVGLRLCGDTSASSWGNLRRLEEISGVPAKLILAVQEKLARVMRERPSRPSLKEGGAECSV